MRVRVLPATIAISVIVHVVIGAGIARFSRRPPPRVEVELLEPTPVEVVEPLPIEVVVIRDPRVGARAGVGAGDQGPESRSPTPTPTPPQAATPTPGPRSLAMRRPGDVEIHLPPAVAHAIAAAEVPPPPPPPVPSGRLAPAGTGAVIHDLVTTAKVDADGDVTFVDKPDFDVGLTLPVPSLDSLRDPHRMMDRLGKDVGTMIEDWAKDPYAQTRAPAVAEMAPHEQAVPGGWDSGGNPGSAATESAKHGTIPILGGAFDLSAWAERMAGNDPYAARKRAMLDATFDERVERRAVHRAAQRDRAAELMRRNLARLWHTTVDPAPRRAALFELWDECEEGDGAAGEAGQRARDQVIGWIRAHLPAGSTDAYSAEELARLAARRRSRQTFTPY